MPFTQVVEHDNFVALIQQKLGANAANVARPANNEDSHRRGKCCATRVKSKRSAGGRRLRDGFASLFLKGCDHLPRAMVFTARGKYFQTLFVRPPLQDVYVHVADAPAFHVEPARLVKVNGVRADQRSPVIVNHIFFARIDKSEPGSEGIARPIRGGTQHAPAGQIFAERIVVAASSLKICIGSSTHVWYATSAGESRFRLRGTAND
jgi:hypothetical protein